MFHLQKNSLLFKEEIHPFLTNIFLSPFLYLKKIRQLSLLPSFSHLFSCVFFHHHHHHHQQQGNFTFFTLGHLLQELHRRLHFALSDPHFSPRFLASNVALLPQLAQLAGGGHGGDDKQMPWEEEVLSKVQSVMGEMDTWIVEVFRGGI